MVKQHLFVLVILLIMACQSDSNNLEDFDVQGHRGCRGLMPENTLPAFQKALELDVNTLELDLAISKDSQLVVSHEPFFRSGLSIDPQGNPISEEDQLNHNIFQMDYDSIKQYDVGSLADDNYPERENIKTFKPLFREVYNKARHYAFIMKSKMPDFNIEIKRMPEYDGIFHPSGKTFADLVIDEIERLEIVKFSIIQSFDPESLRFVKARRPDIRTALLIENDRSVEENISELGFKPDIYSCYFKLLDEESIKYCREREIKVIPWTVNETEDMKALIDMGVDGIITDYPDRLIPLVRK